MYAGGRGSDLGRDVLVTWNTGVLAATLPDAWSGVGIVVSTLSYTWSDVGIVVSTLSYTWSGVGTVVSTLSYTWSGVGIVVSTLSYTWSGVGIVVSTLSYTWPGVGIVVSTLSYTWSGVGIVVSTLSHTWSRDTEINDLSTALASLCRRHEVTLQWIPSHCNLPGNEAADSLAKEGTTKEQVDRSTSYPEVKTILKAKQHSKWRHKHPRYNKADPYYLLTRREQVTVFRLRTGHNRLNYHLYSKLRIGHTEQCPCGTGSQTTEHLLQFCPTYEPLRKGIWPDHTPLARKLYGSLRDLQCTATFIGETGISI